MISRSFWILWKGQDVRRHLHRLIGLALIVTAAATVVACGTAPLAPEARSPDIDLEPVTLQLRWFHQFQFAGYYAAIDQGYYRDAGFAVTLVEGDPSLYPDPIAPVIDGRAQYGVSGRDLLVKRAEGAPVVVLSSIFQHSPLALGVRSDRNISTPQDLVGKQLVMPLTVRTAEVQAVLAAEGVDVNDITIVGPPVVYPDYLFDAQNDGWSLYHTNEPFLLERAGILVNYIEPRTYGIDFYGDSLFTSEEEIRSHPARAERFRAASLRGWEYAMAHPNEIIDLIIRQYGGQKTRAQLEFEAAKMRDFILPDIVDLGHVNPERWQRIADVYAGLGMIEAGSSIDGFLYERQAEPNLTRVYWTLGVTGAMLVLIGLTAFFLAYLNRSLRGLVRARTAELEAQNLAMQREAQEREKSALALRESEERFRAIWEISSDGMALSDADGTVIAANPAYLQLYDLTAEQTIGKEFAVIFPEAVREWAREQYHVIFRTPELPPSYDAEIRRGDGGMRNVESRVSFLTHDGDRIAMLSMIRDITDRVQREAEKRRQGQILDAVGQAIVTADSEGMVTYCNSAAQQLFGVVGATPLTKPLADLVPTLLSEAQATESEAALAAGQVWSGEVLVQGQSRNWFPCLVTRSPLLNDAGVRMGVIHVYSDLTTLKRIEENFRQAQKLEAIGTLAGGIAHDLNNILTPIFAFTELAQAEVDEGSRIYRNLARVLEASNRARDLVMQILTYSRSIKQEIEPFDIAPVLHEALSLLEATIPSTIEIRRQIEPGPHPIMAHPSHIHQVIMNLGTNAYQAIGERQGQIGIGLSTIDSRQETCSALHAMPPGLYVKLTVSDSGSGMDQETIARIFDPFFTTKERGKGTGLGLSVVSGIVKSLGGTIDVQSAPNQGTTFDVYVPHALLEPAAAPRSKEYPETGAGHILAIDDDEAILDALNATLTAGGYEVTTVSDSRAGLACFEQSPDTFSAVILDQVMPKLTGDQCAERILQRSPNTPIIMLSGYSDRIAADCFEELGVRAFIQKPFDNRSLLATLQQLIAG